jgi:hypothetical protein
MEVEMAKGQKRSNRETKKPKKPTAAKPKAGMASAFSQSPGATQPPSRKR